MAPTSCFTGQVHNLPDAPEAYGAMITRAKAAPAQSRSADLGAMDALANRSLCMVQFETNKLEATLSANFPYLFRESENGGVIYSYG